VYGPWAMRVIDKGCLDRYFKTIGKSYLIRDEVKSLVDFSHLNLLTDDFPTPATEFRDIDIIFCRNVMIYFSLATTRHVVDKFASSLVPGGCLFLGHAETLSQISTRFERHTQAGGFYYRARRERDVPAPRAEPAPSPAKERIPLRQPAPLPPATPQPPIERQRVPSPPRPAADPEEIYRKAVTLFDAEKFDDASLVLGELLVAHPDHTGGLVFRGFIQANRGRFQEAFATCNTVLGIDDLLPEAYFLRGLLLDMNDSPEEAVTEYRKTILLRMDFVMSHYYLGRLYYRLGNISAGARELRNTLKILEKAHQGSIIPFSGGLTREVLLQQVSNELVKKA
jgi:chemotaxis protein methyltransferase CheR